jgi:hypothetical protein
MAGVSLTIAQTNLDKWIAASEALAGNQSYSINGRSLNRANVDEVLRMITYWEKRVAILSGSRRTVRYGVGE